MKKTMIDLRECIKPAINASGYKCMYVAQQVGMTDQQLSDVMNKRRGLEVNEMMKICEVLDISPNELMGYGVEADKKVG